MSPLVRASVAFTVGDGVAQVIETSFDGLLMVRLLNVLAAVLLRVCAAAPLKTTAPAPAVNVVRFRGSAGGLCL